MDTGFLAILITIGASILFLAAFVLIVLVLVGVILAIVFLIITLVKKNKAKKNVVDVEAKDIKE